MDYIRTIASQCHALKRLITSSGPPFSRHVYHIARDKISPDISITMYPIKDTSVPGLEYFGRTEWEQF
jgi:hypothetical protein